MSPAIKCCCSWGAVFIMHPKCIQDLTLIAYPHRTHTKNNSKILSLLCVKIKNKMKKGKQLDTSWVELLSPGAELPLETSAIHWFVKIVCITRIYVYTIPLLPIYQVEENMYMYALDRLGTLSLSLLQLLASISLCVCCRQVKIGRNI